MNERENCLDEPTCGARAAAFGDALFLLDTFFVNGSFDHLLCWKIFMVQDVFNIKKHNQRCLYFGVVFVVHQNVGHLSHTLLSHI
jgi:hypothetical protein